MLPYAIALKTGNPAAVNSSFLLFLPVTFLTTVFVPEEALTGWMAQIVKFNPVTYLLQGQRSLISDGWVLGDLLAALAGIGAIAVVSVPFAMWALLGRVRRS
jgi:ABC-2 type transport system permease protein